LFYNLKNAEMVTAVMNQWNKPMMQRHTEGLDFPVKMKATDAAFFDLYDFDFLAGAPYTKEDVGSGLFHAVITDRTARKVFGTDDYASAVGQDVKADYQSFRVVGVVREGTPTEIASYANIYVPYTTRREWDREFEQPLIGSYEVMMLTDDIDALREEINDYLARFSNSNNYYMVRTWNQPVPHEWVAFSDVHTDEFSLPGLLLSLFGIVFILMLVPTLNLSGIISGRMESRMAEMGVRKSFGASRSRLLGEVLVENFVFTVIGGAIGFVMAYFFLKSGGGDLFSKGFDRVSGEITNEMIFSPMIFAILLTLCFLLNIMSALIPAMRSLRRPIVESLKEI
ncbi:MAG: ABC transporter permease, partial [Muribaculaceae bacterium]|nr:ABC transporter permease [Muribaculaceae bacterium]